MLAVALAVLAPAARAHTQIQRATPGPGEVVEGDVDSVVLEFLDPVMPTPTIEVTGPDGAPVAGLGDTRSSGDDVATVDFDALTEAGEYRVDYSWVAVDGAAQQGAHQFSFEPSNVDQTRPVLPVTTDTLRLFLHVLAATIWVGGQLTLAGLVPGLRALDPDAPRMAARRFNRIAWPAFAVLVVTGVWNVFESSVGDRGTDWQLTLLVKLVVVALSGVSAAAHATTSSRVVLAAAGAVAGLTSLLAVFLGVQLTFG